MEKLLPQNIEAESGVLGSIIIDPEAVVQVADFLAAEDFYRDAHRTIYEVILQLYERHEPADFITICDELERRNRLEEVGGASYITSLINQVPTSGNVEYYGRIVERTAILRRLIHAAGQIAAVAYEEGDADLALDKAEQLIFGISQRHARADFSVLRDLLADYMEKLDQLHERRGTIVGVPTGFTDLDRLTGGLQRSDLIILAARPAVGKCLPAWTLIDHPETGERLTIEEYVHRRISVVYSLSDCGKIQVSQVADWVDSGVKPCYRVQTRLGRMVEVTGHHPFLTIHGWIPLHDLKVGQYIAVPTRVDCFGNDESWPIEKVRLLASSVAKGKSLPACVWTWSKRYLAELLRALMSYDGSIYAMKAIQDRPIIEFCVASPQLAADVCHALLRFGIVAKYHRTTNNTWRVHITSAEDVRKYQEQIGWIGETTKVGKYAGCNSHTNRTIPGRRLAAYAEVLEDTALQRIASPDIYWDEIVSIEPIGEHQVYDLTVPDGANFIAQDVFVHNTSLALSLAHNASIRHQQSVAIFSLEMSKEQLVQRLLSMDASIDQQRLRTGWIEDDEWERIITAMETLSQANLWIDDTAGISTMEMRSKARRLQAEQGIDLIIVDYLQLMQSSTGNKRNENRVQEISEISRNLKGLARELDVPVLALAQLSRAVESRQSKVPQLSDLRESGCLTGDTPVYLPDEGIYRPIEQFVGRSGLRVLALNTETWKLEPRVVTNAFVTGKKFVYRLTTRLGRSIRATANHKFLTIHGWKHLDELTTNDRIALPRVLPGPVQSTMTDDELALLGHLIGDGCTLPRHAIQYTANDQSLADLVAQLAKQVFGDMIIPRVKKERDWYQVYLAAGYHLTHSTRNPIVKWLEQLGIFGLRSYEKRVPNEVFAQPVAGIALFLRHLWSTDGCVHLSTNKHHYANIYYASSSPILAQNVQSLLLRLGINAKLARRSQSGKGRDQYHVIVSGKSDVEAFLKLIGGLGENKSKHQEAIISYMNSRHMNTNRDVVPADVWRLFAVPAMQVAGLTTRSMQAALGNAYCGTGLYKQNLSRERTTKLAQIVACEHLTYLAASDVYWDSVAAIEPEGEEDVYDLTVDGLHNFVAGDILVHNSIEQDADIVMFIYRDDVYNPDSERKNIADIIVAKHRNGPVGEISLYFQASQTRFRDLEVSPPAE